MLEISSMITKFYQYRPERKCILLAESSHFWQCEYLPVNIRLEVRYGDPAESRSRNRTTIFVTQNFEIKNPSSVRRTPSRNWERNRYHTQNRGID